MSTANTVWIVDDDRSIRWVLEKALNQAGITTQTFDSGETILNSLRQNTPDAIISDIRMPGMDGLELLGKINETHPDLPVIITTAHSDLDSAVASYQGGAFEYLPKPFDIDDAVAMTERALLHANEKTADSTEPEENSSSTEIIGEAPAMQEVFRAIGRLSHSNITFTGATSLRPGRFEQADGGTLFLDEIGDMPSETQTRLLRVLADGEFYRVGGHVSIKVDVRIIAATHQNLEALVKEGRFREDLFHRLNVIRIHIPSLRNRREDLPKLMQHFLLKASEELNTETKLLTTESEHYLSKLDWPGNVRQLENTCRWITVMAAGREIHLEDLPPELLDQTIADGGTDDGNWQDNLRRWADQELSLGKSNILDTAIPIFEKLMIDTALKHTHGRKRDAAVLLGWGRNTLTRKMNELGMNTTIIDSTES